MTKASKCLGTQFAGFLWKDFPSFEPVDNSTEIMKSRIVIN